MALVVSDLDLVRGFHTVLVEYRSLGPVPRVLARDPVVPPDRARTYSSHGESELFRRALQRGLDTVRARLAAAGWHPVQWFALDVPRASSAEAGPPVGGPATGRLLGVDLRITVRVTGAAPAEAELLRADGQGRAVLPLPTLGPSVQLAHERICRRDPPTGSRLGLSTDRRWLVLRLASAPTLHADCAPIVRDHLVPAAAVLRALGLPTQPLDPDGLG